MFLKKHKNLVFIVAICILALGIAVGFNSGVMSSLPLGAW